MRSLWPLVLISAAIVCEAQNYRSTSLTPPPPAREFRGAWIATVGNIDWPSAPGLTTQQQKSELVALLDRAVQLRLNAVIFQVRPACDAMYASKIEPWSEFLTGTMGKAPAPYYDPLEFAVTEAHRRGLELHAWFNPYRARSSVSKAPISALHVSKTHPSMVHQYGKQLWLDPGEKEVQDYSLRVVMDVVDRYDIDGVHFDDYFYPYREQDAAGRPIDFPDESSWKRYGAGHGLSREDWRRANVDTFIERVYQSIKAAKPHVKFGVSPFGIWRPGQPPQIKGFDAFGGLYADSRKWLQRGWVDYFAPQLYWSIDSPGQSFPTLLHWWAQQNTKGRTLVAGIDSTHTTRHWKPEEIVNQIKLTRKEPGVGGHIHWDMKSLGTNGPLGIVLEREVYQVPALVPEVRWLWAPLVERPKLKISARNGTVHASWRPGGSAQVWLWLLQTRAAGEWRAELLPANTVTQSWSGSAPDVIAVTAVDRLGNCSHSTSMTRTVKR